MTPTSQGVSAHNRDALPARDAYEAPKLVALGTLAELTGSLVVGVESDHTLPGTHLISGPGGSPGS